MIIGRLRIQSTRENINFRIRRAGIFLVNQIYTLGPSVAISLKIAAQFSQEFSLNNRQFKMTYSSLAVVRRR